ncbi:tryptophan-rich sensory protein [Salinimicrobium sp. GXAS 041]|uniref:tryptophan-rich sensory protein n=1 Tax=Salinimicrobium sp. GXAS 041 TaxID=3400806 RepID=UPI003C76C4EC
MKKLLQVSNAIAFLVVVVMNYLANTGIFNGDTMGSVSAQYENLFTPAGYAFSIWGLIYIGLAGFIVYQGRSLFSGAKESDEVVDQIGWWFVISCIANCAWIVTWLYNYTGISVVIMIVLLFSLIKIILNTRMELDDLPLPSIAFLWWPFSLYSGWITLALIANVAAFLTKIDWDGFGISSVTWTIIMIGIAGILNLMITWTRNMREFALVGVWGLVGIAVANWNEAPVVQWWAVIVASILFISSSYHGYKNREYAPFRKRK